MLKTSRRNYKQWTAFKHKKNFSSFLKFHFPWQKNCKNMFSMYVFSFNQWFYILYNVAKHLEFLWVKILISDNLAHVYHVFLLNKITTLLMFPGTCFLDFCKLMKQEVLWNTLSINFLVANWLILRNLPTRILKTLLLAYSSISLNQSGRQSKVGWHEMSYTSIRAWADL